MGIGIIFVRMGFPVGYTEVVFPKVVVQILCVLGFIRRLISTIFRYIIDTDTDSDMPQFHSVIREILPVVKFSDLLDPPDTCAVCLNDFHHHDHIRRLTNCPHIFHQGCLDRWMGYDQRTCPLCRTPFISEDFNHTLCPASGIPQQEFHHHLASFQF